MRTHEAWIHIAAPSTRRDDQSYEAQAATVAAFEPATRIQIYPAEHLVVETFQEQDTVPQSSAASQTRHHQQNTAPPSTPSVVQTSGVATSSTDYLTSSEGHVDFPRSLRPAHTGSPSLRWSLELPEQWPPLLPHEIKAINPPYRNPFTGRSVIQVLQTSDDARPKTAPSVPASASPRHAPARQHKRSHSESSSFETPASVVPDSQSGQNDDDRFTLRGRRHYKRRRLDSSEEYYELERSSSSGPAHRTSSDGVINLDSGYTGKSKSGVQKTPMRDHSTSRAETSFTIVPATEQQEVTCFFLANRDYDYDTSVSSSSSSDDETTTYEQSTVSPTQPMRPPPRTKTPSALREPEQVDLTTPVPTNSSPSNESSAGRHNPDTSPLVRTAGRAAQGEHASGPVNHHRSESRQQPQQPTVEVPPSPSAQINPFPRITALPTAILPSPPATGSEQSTQSTHITPHLALLAEKLSIAKRFRPNHVTRDVSSSERGYWHLSITIADDETVTKTRHQIEEIRKAKLKRSATIATAVPSTVDEAFLLAQTPEPAYLWTESDFLSLHAALSQHYHTSIVGWGCRVFLDFQPSAPPRQILNVEMKVTCWGEVIPHLYLTLWVLSDRRSAEMAMEWRDGAEEVVVRMRGGGMRRVDPMRKGEVVRGLGWGRKGEGTWGMMGMDVPVFLD